MLLSLTQLEIIDTAMALVLVSANLNLDGQETYVDNSDVCEHSSTARLWRSEQADD
jgi:hypothetical protein